MSRPSVDLADGAFYGGDPHPAFAWMRGHEPLYRDVNGLWGVTLHEDIMSISKEPRTFINGQGMRPDAPPMPMMISMDAPEHTLRRNLVSKGFTPRRVSEMEPKIRSICTGILDDICERGSCDFVRDVAALLPMIVIGDLLGVRPEDRDDLLRWSDVMLSAVGSPQPGMLEEAGRAMTEYTEYHRAVVADRRSHPSDDLMGVLVRAEVDGKRLDDDSLLYESLLILIGGDETTRHVISGGMYELLRHPDQLRMLAREPARIEVAVEEMLRWVSPIQNMMRTTSRPVELRGQKLDAGERLLLLYPAANRDECVFERPDVFDVTRDPNRHVAFGGYGSHICLGKSLARLELRVMFEELLRRFADMELESAVPPPRRAANFVVGIESLPVCFVPRSREAWIPQAPPGALR